MIPTEHEYTAATHAAAKVKYAQYHKANPDQTLPEDWGELPLHLKRTFLENVLPIVDAAISAIPDRLDGIRTLVDTTMTDAEFRRVVVKLVERDVAE